jgi:hypothetical protein
MSCVRVATLLRKLRSIPVQSPQTPALASGCCKKKKTPLKLVFAQESESLVNKGIYHQGLHRAVHIQAIQG